MSEVVAFGEAMLRFCPPDRLRIGQADRFEIQIGGAELNAAVGLAQLGRKVGWVSRLPDNPLGQLLASRVREAGVSTEHVLFAPGERLGLFFLEQGAAPRPASICYDRASSACANLRPGMVDWPKVFAGAKWFHLSGIAAAIGAGPAAVAREGLEAARGAGLTVSFDPNYRSKLWSRDDARAWYLGAMPYIDVLITSPEDAADLFGIAEPEPEAGLQKLAEMFHLRASAYTFRSGEAVWRDAYSSKVWFAGKVHSSRVYPVEIVDRIGAGDAFAAGLIDGLLDGDGARAAECGAAMGALKHTVAGDFALTTRAEIDEIIAGGSLRLRR